MPVSTPQSLRLLCIGHSHLRCVREAAELAADSLSAAGITINTLVLQQPRMNPDLTAADPDAEWLTDAQHHELLALAEDADDVLLSVGGNAHIVFGLVEHAQPFDFVMDPVPTLATGRQPVPRALVHAALAGSSLYRRHSALRHRLHGILRGAVRSPLAQIESPPPARDDAHIRRHPGFYRDLIAERGVAPAVLRHKLWRLHSALVAQDCHDHDIAFIAAPLAVQDAAGYLAAPALADDPTHANAWYGRRLIEQLVRRHRPEFALPEPA